MIFLHRGPGQCQRSEDSFRRESAGTRGKLSGKVRCDSISHNQPSHLHVIHGPSTTRLRSFTTAAPLGLGVRPCAQQSAVYGHEVALSAPAASGVLVAITHLSRLSVLSPRQLARLTCTLHLSQLSLPHHTGCGALLGLGLTPPASL